MDADKKHRCLSSARPRFRVASQVQQFDSVFIKPFSDVNLSTSECSNAWVKAVIFNHLGCIKDTD
jgi:hypothetical protein